MKNVPTNMIVANVTGLSRKYSVTASQVKRLRELGDNKGTIAREMLKKVIDKYK